jgi:hypothetical protein
MEVEADGRLQYVAYRGYSSRTFGSLETAESLPEAVEDESHMHGDVGRAY